MIQNFSIFKKKEVKTDKSPTHGISTKVGDEFVDLGACWTKKTANGDSYLSCQLSKPFTKTNGEVVGGYVLISQMEYDQLKKTGVADIGKTSNGDKVPDFSEVDNPY